MNYKTLLIAATTAILLFNGCDADRGTTLQDSLVGNTVEDKIAGFAVFNPTEGLIPYPNNILFADNDSSGSGDGYDYGKTLNIPYETSDADAVIKQQLNELTGFSTISPITAPVTATLDLSSIPAGVQVYQVDINATGFVTGIIETLTFGPAEDYVATQSGSNIVILPTKPLKSYKNYMVVLTSDLKDTAGRILAPDIATALTLGPNPVEASSSLDAPTAAALEAIRQGNRQMMTVLALAGKDPSNTVQIWNFRTQKIGTIQDKLAAYGLYDANLTLANPDMNTSLFNPGLKGYSKVLWGTLNNIPQFMPQASSSDPTNAFIGNISLNNGVLVVEANVSIPVMVTVPNYTGCNAPYPVIIYQHGITRSRIDMLALSDTFGSHCYAAIAIDLPLHGETNTLSPFYNTAGLERTFDIDKDEDGVIDSTGKHYMNFLHISTTRDNMHQTTSDLLQLEQALVSDIIINGDVNNTFDTTNIHFVTHSLGGIVSTGYINHTTKLKTITLAMPGQGVIQLLNNSVAFGPEIETELAKYQIYKGTAAYESFMLASQTIVDDADPANMTLESDLKILSFEIIGSDGFASDKTIPNYVATAPLSGTDPFLRQMSALDINSTQNGIVTLDSNKTVTRLLYGHHSSLLRPNEEEGVAPTNLELGVYFEINNQMISFIQYAGSDVNITNIDLIK